MTWEVSTPVFRSLEHRHVAQTLKQKPLTDTPDLERLGIAFAELQQFREWAGYNPEPRPNMQATGSSQPFTREEALGLIDTASLAIDILDRLDDETRLRLAVRLVARSRK